MWMGPAMAGNPATADRALFISGADQTSITAPHRAPIRRRRVILAPTSVNLTILHTLMSDKILSEHVVWCVECTVSIGCHWFVLG